MTATYDFDQQLGLSYGDADTKSAAVIASVPHAASVRVATTEEDRKGTDYWVSLTSGHELSVDVKHNTRDPIDTFGEDTLIIEWWSAREYRKPGWTVDPAKRTDYILYWFAPTKRYALVPFPLLFAAATAHRDDWCTEYGTRTTTTVRSGVTWTTEFSPVPRVAVWRAIYEVAHGRAA